VSYFNVDIESTESDVYNFAVTARKEVTCSIVVADLKSSEAFWNEHQMKVRSILEVVKTEILVILNGPDRWSNMEMFSSKAVVMTGLIFQGYPNSSTTIN